MPAQRGFVFALMTLGPALGPALLSPLLALLPVAFSWRATWALLGAIGAVWVLAFLLVTRERQPARTMQKTIPWKTLFSLLWKPAVILTMLASFASDWYLALLISPGSRTTVGSLTILRGSIPVVKPSLISHYLG